ncbi:toxin-antitoxin system HicB family antitoxin [Achromobacter denitrificans]
MSRFRQLKLEIPPDLHSLLECAADLEGRPVNDFVADAR